MQEFVRRLAVGALLGVAAAAPARAENTGDPLRGRSLYLSVYAGQWIEGSLLEVPVRMLTADLQTRPARFLGGGFGYVLVPAFDLPVPFCGDCVLRGNSVELEGVLLKHGEEQDHWEVAGGVFARSGQIPLMLGISLNLAAGAGLSCAFSDPALENGRGGERGLDTYRLQIFLAFETELAHRALDGWSIVGRIHHRSGGYGMLTEVGSGSNFIALGLRRGF